MSIVVNSDGSFTLATSLIHIDTNIGSTSLTKANLNTLYPTRQPGDVVIVPSVNLKYTKIDSTNWDEQPLNQVA